MELGKPHPPQPVCVPTPDSRSQLSSSSNYRGLATYIIEVADALPALGLSTTRARGGGCGGVWARRGDTRPWRLYERGLRATKSGRPLL